MTKKPKQGKQTKKRASSLPPPIFFADSPVPSKVWMSFPPSEPPHFFVPDPPTDGENASTTTSSHGEATFIFFYDSLPCLRICNHNPSVSGRVNVNRFGHLKVNIRTCKSEQKSEHFSCVRTARSVAIKGRRPSALRAFTPPLAAVEARGAGEPGPFELRLCGPFPCRKVVAA